MVPRRVRRSRAYQRIRTASRYADGKVRRRILYGVGGLVVLGAVWIVITGLIAAQRIRTLESQLQQVKYLVAQGRIPDAQRASVAVPDLARSAHRLTTGPAWWLAAQVPYFGDPLDVVRGATAAGDQIGSRGVPTLLDVATSLEPPKLRRAGNTIALGPLAAAQPRLRSASALLDRAVRHMDGLPTSTWFSQVDSTRSRLSVQLHSISGYVAAASRAADIMPTMLGTDAPKRYFIGLQNEAEVRGTGGLAGAFAIAVANRGKITFTHFESDAALLPAATGQRIVTGLDFGPGYKAAYAASDPTNSILDSNVSPDFPYTAQIWAKMWQQVSGEHVDGAMALDPQVLSYFLTATGPVTLPGGRVLTAQDVVPLTERDEYALFTDNTVRKAFLVSILKGASKQLISGRGNTPLLAQALVQSSKEQRLQVWSSDPAVEARLAETSYGGVIPQDNRPLVAPILNNAAAGKLDYYLTRTLTYHRSGCDAQRDVLVTMTLTNDAPASGLSTYVTGRIDKNKPPNVRPGDNRTLLDYYATSGAQLLSATLNGAPTTANVQRDLGHPIFRMDLELPRGTTQTIVLHLQEPAGAGSPVIWRQPGVNPMAVTADSQPCS